MTRKRWFIAGVAAVAALVVLGVGGAAAMRHDRGPDAAESGLGSRVAEILQIEEARVRDALDQTHTEDADSLARNFASRVAEILGIEETRVQEAMDQARQEMLSERLQDWLDKMVESGRITQEQADEYKAWIESRPDGAFKHFGKRGHHGRGFHRGWHWDRGNEAPSSEGAGIVQ